jgi:hypothetical protein
MRLFSWLLQQIGAAGLPESPRSGRSTSRIAVGPGAAFFEITWPLSELHDALSHVQPEVCFLKRSGPRGLAAKQDPASWALGLPPRNDTNLIKETRIMSFIDWLATRLSVSTPLASRRKSPVSRRTFQPRLEGLESRCVPSTLTVTTSAESGTSSLRATIAAAQSGDTVVFAPSLAGQTITLTKGELLLKKNLAIVGPGAGELTISGNQASRVFEVASGMQVTLSGLTISNGLVVGGDGGGILNGGNLTVSGSIVSANSANILKKGGNLYGGSGGGIYNSGTLTVTGNSTLSGNSTVNGGAGISNVGMLTVINSALLQNTGSGIYNSDTGTASVSGSILSGNSAWAGAGIWNGGTLTVSGSTLSNNVARSSGGGIGNYGTGIVSVSGSTLSGNSAADNGGGIFNNGTLTLSGGSSLSGNTAQRGGGIYNGFYATATVKNSSTITGNTALAGYGADVYNLGVLYLDSSSTISVLDGNPAVPI